MFSLLFSFILLCICFCDHLALVRVRIKKILTYTSSLILCSKCIASSEEIRLIPDFPVSGLVSVTAETGKPFILVDL